MYNIPEEGGKGTNHQIVALIPQTHQFCLQTYKKRIESCIRREMSNEQNTFKTGWKKWVHLANVYSIKMDNEKNKKIPEIYVCFMEYSKAFDCLTMPEAAIY